jgi:hypothetical protein
VSLVDRALLFALRLRGYGPAMLMAPQRDEDVAAERVNNAQLRQKVALMDALGEAVLGVKMPRREKSQHVQHGEHV